MSDDVPVEFFSDLRHEVELAAQRYAELMVERDALRADNDALADDLSRVAFAVAGDRTGVIHEDAIVGLVKGVVAERDRLRAALRAVMAETGTSTLAHHYARDALDVSPTGGGRVTERHMWVSPIDRHHHWGDAGRAECAVCCLEAERDRLRAVVAAVAICGTCNYCQQRAHAVLDVSPSMGEAGQ